MIAGILSHLLLLVSRATTMFNSCFGCFKALIASSIVKPRSRLPQTLMISSPTRIRPSLQ